MLSRRRGGRGVGELHDVVLRRRSSRGGDGVLGAVSETKVSSSGAVGVAGADDIDSGNAMGAASVDRIGEGGKVGTADCNRDR